MIVRIMFGRLHPLLLYVGFLKVMAVVSDGLEVTAQLGSMICTSRDGKAPADTAE